jgi:membrane protein DedA with SNARE-associated domain
MLADLLEKMTQFVETIVLSLGLPGIALIAVFENLFPPTPSEFLYPLAGKMAYDGELTVFGVVTIGVLGTLFASTLWYLLGKRLGEERVRHFIDRYGTLRLWKLKLELFTGDQFDRAMELFRTRGAAIVIVARVLPYVHSVVSIPAGVIQMPYWRFLIYTAIGSLLWILPLTLLGYFLGSQWRQVLTWMDTYQTVILIALGVLLVYWLGRKFWRARAEAATVKNN